VHPYHFKSTKKMVGGTKKFIMKNPLARAGPYHLQQGRKYSGDVEKLSEICPVWVTNIITIEDTFR
jgi:hypothetical protein